MQSFLKKYAQGLVLVLACIAIAWTATQCNSGHQAKLKASIDSLHVAQDSLHLALKANASRDVAIVALTQVADQNQRAALRQKHFADSAGAEARSLRAIIDTTPLPILAVCAPIIDQANAIIVRDTLIIHVLLDANDSLATAFDHEHLAALGLRASLDSAVASQSLLTHAALRVDSAASRVVRNTGLPFFVRFAPKFGVGAALGVDVVTRQPAVVIGVTFGWPR